MRVELSGGQSAEFREQFLRGDRRTALKAVKLSVREDGSRTIDLSQQEDMICALLRSMMISWTVPQTLPRDAASMEVAQQILDGLDDADYQRLADVVRPYTRKILRDLAPQRDEDPKAASAPTGTSSSAGADAGPPTPAG